MDDYYLAVVFRRCPQTGSLRFYEIKDRDGASRSALGTWCSSEDSDFTELRIPWTDKGCESRILDLEARCKRYADRLEAREAGIDPEAFEEGDIITPEDIAEFSRVAHLLSRDRPAEPRKEELLPNEVVADRGELVNYAATMTLQHVKIRDLEAEVNRLKSELHDSECRLRVARTRACVTYSARTVLEAALDTIAEDFSKPTT